MSRSGNKFKSPGADDGEGGGGSSSGVLVGGGCVSVDGEGERERDDNNGGGYRYSNNNHNNVHYNIPHANPRLIQPHQFVLDGMNNNRGTSNTRGWEDVDIFGDDDY